MINQCPHCTKELQLNDAQQEKIRDALENLKSGTLKLGCPLCKKAIHLAKDGTVVAEDKSNSEQTAPERSAASPAEPAVITQSPIQPPACPDIGWLVSGIYEEQDIVEDVLKVLILMPEGPGRDAVEKAFVERGYQADFPESAQDAIAQMRFVPFAAVVLHDEFDGGFANSQFHRHMQAMPMTVRRAIFYVLAGKEFHTLYDLEALSYSANVVVNDSEIEHIDVILKKGMQDYKDLFAPYIDALQAAGMAS